MNINPEGRATIDVEQALPVFKSAAATSVVTLLKRFDNAVFLASWGFVAAHPVRGLRLSDDMCAERLEQSKCEPALPTRSDAAASSTAPVGQLSKRFDYAKMTFHDDKLGACGHINQPAGLVVALNAAQYDSGHHCGQCIRIRANGKTTIAQVVDECPSYEGEGLDLSNGLFEHFAPDAQGDLVGSWDFIDKYQHGHKVCLLVFSSLAFTHELSSAPA
jgi:hypothetical protein